MISGGERGLSPVVATVLLVSITLVLAVIIFFWARTFISDDLQKQGSAVELLCPEVSFEASTLLSSVLVENTGSVPIHGVEIRKKSIFGDIVQVETSDSEQVGAGETIEFPLPSGVAGGDEVIVVPVLLGETTNERKAHICGEEYGREIVVGS